MDFSFVLTIRYCHLFFFPPFVLIHASNKLSESGLVVSSVSPCLETVLLVFRCPTVCFNAAIQTELILNNKFPFSSASLVILP